MTDLIPPPRPNFPIGVHAQPPETYTKWKGRGYHFVCVLDRRGGTIAQADARAAARAAGLFYVDLPGPDLAADARDPWLLGWVVGHAGASSYYDEPDRAARDGKVPRADVGDYQACVAKLKAVASDKWILAAMSSDITNAKDATPPYDGRNHRPFLSGCTHGTVAWYVANKNPDRYFPAHLIAAGLNKLKEFGPPGLIRGAYLECSDQMLDGDKTPRIGRGPTTAEMRVELEEAVGAGAQFAIYFPQRVDNHFAYDNQTIEQAQMVTNLISMMNPVAPPPPPPPVIVPPPAPTPAPATPAVTVEAYMRHRQRVALAESSSLVQMQEELKHE